MSGRVGQRGQGMKGGRFSARPIFFAALAWESRDR